MHPVIFITISLAVIGLTFFFDFGFLKSLRLQIESGNYSVTYGTVVTSRLEKNHRKPDCPVISYEYTLAGNTFHSGRLRYMEKGREMETALTKFPLGKVVTVYYDKSDPSKAVLYPGIEEAEVLKSIGWFLFTNAVVVTGILVARRFVKWNQWVWTW